MNRPILVAVALAVAAPAAAQPPASGARAEHTAIRLEEPVTVDGKLTETVWQNGHAISGFKQRDPHEGAEPSNPTEVRVAYDDEAIYVGARLHDAAPDSILARLTRRDVSIPADRFAVYLDPFCDRRSGYYFMVNAGGTLYDGTLSNDGWEDSSWDGVWQGKAALDDGGWSVEMRIPYSQLRFRSAERWGINFRRVIQRHNEENFLVYQPKKEAGFVSRFPDLVGLAGIRPGSAVEVLPYVTGKSEHFAGDSDQTPDAGLDLRVGVGSKLTLNATVNPDFGQVEVDPAVVNLSDVETFFQEKRPFFVEGSSVFGFGQEGANDYWGFNWPQPTFFYSRRIGRAPQGGTPDDADVIESPLGTTILGAAKLTGKLSSSWNVGTLHALTGKESADLVTGGARRDWEVEPLTYYGVARGLRDFGERRHGVGFMANVAARGFDDDRLRAALNETSIMAGTDGWTFLDRNKTWVISGWTAMSHVRGSRDRMTALQQDPRHYFQRPDASHIEVDPDATSLTGFGSRYWLNKQKGSTLLNAAVGFMTPEFDVNDLGFLSRTDVVNFHLGGGHRWTETTWIRKHQSAVGAVYGSYDFQGNPIWGGLYGEGSTEFINNYSWSYWGAYNPRIVDTRRTRGGPAMLRPQGFNAGTYFDTDGKAKRFYYVETTVNAQPEAGTWDWYVGPGVEWKPSSNLTVRAGPSLYRLQQDAQYLASYADPTASRTFGRRYVFGELDQTTVAANLRLNWAFTPALSFQCFVQPLISVGDYSNLKSLAGGRSYDFDRYGADGSTFDPATGTIDADGPGAAPAYALGDPDFNFRSLRGNAVLRWEYLPGSALFLVWTQERTDAETLDELEFGRSVRRLFSADARNIFLVKASYYFAL